MKPRYRAMILGDDLTPVSQLSAAFLPPKTPLHLQFAYYESSLVVEWLVQKLGPRKDEAHARRSRARHADQRRARRRDFAPIEKLDAEFAAFAKELRRNVGPQLDLDAAEARRLRDAEARRRTWLETHPDNFAALPEQAQQLVADEKWAAAKTPLQKLIDPLSRTREPDNAYALLARSHRELGEADAERAMLEQARRADADAPDGLRRLMEIAAAATGLAQVLD